MVKKAKAFELATTMVRLMREGKSYILDILLKSKFCSRLGKEEET